MRLIKEKTRTLRSFLAASGGSIKEKTLRSAVWVTLTSVGVNSLAFVRSIILARLLGPEIFGVMGIIWLVIKGFEILTTTGFSAALIHRSGEVDDAKATAFSLTLLRGFSLAIILVITAPWLADLYDKEVLDLALKVVAISFLINGFSNINLVILQKNLNFKRISYLEQIASLVATIAVVTLAYYWRSVWALVIGHVFGTLVHTVLSYTLIPGQPKFGFQARLARELFSYGKFITGATIALYVAGEIDKAVIGKLLGMEELGFYVIAFMIGNLPATHIAKVASRVLFPAYSKLQNNPETLRAGYVDVMRMITAVTMPAAFGLMAIAGPFISVVYGPGWTPAVEPLVILCIFGSIRAMTQVNGYLLNGIGRPNINLNLILVRLLLVGVLIFPLTKSHGLVGVAWSVTIPIALQLVLGVFAMKRLLDVDVVRVVRGVGRNFGYSLVMAGTLVWVSAYVEDIGIAMLLLMVVVGGCLYLMLNKKEILDLVALVRGKGEKQPSGS